MRILGIDPGLQHTGWALLTLENRRLSSPLWGTISPPRTLPMAERLAHLFHAIDHVIKDHAPCALILEKTLVGKGAFNSLLLAHARSVPLTLAGLRAIPCFEYAPTQVKKNITSYGKASKKQMIFIIEKMLNLKTSLDDHAADALAMAITHAYTAKLL